jgi:hypothetical protein
MTLWRANRNIDRTTSLPCWNIRFNCLSSNYLKILIIFKIFQNFASEYAKVFPKNTCIPSWKFSPIRIAEPPFWHQASDGNICLSIGMEGCDAELIDAEEQEGTEAAGNSARQIKNKILKNKPSTVPDSLPPLLIRRPCLELL